MSSSGMLLRVDLVRTDVSEELSASFIRVTRISEVGTTLSVETPWNLIWSGRMKLYVPDLGNSWW
jgi:hypothetical protein